MREHGAPAVGDRDSDGRRGRAGRNAGTVTGLEAHQAAVEADGRQLATRLQQSEEHRNQAEQQLVTAVNGAQVFDLPKVADGTAAQSAVQSAVQMTQRTSEQLTAEQRQERQLSARVTVLTTQREQQAAAVTQATRVAADAETARQVLRRTGSKP